jgi:hypothetical protein
MDSLSPEGKILMYIAVLKKEGKITPEEVDSLKGKRTLNLANDYSLDISDASVFEDGRNGERE